MRLAPLLLLLALAPALHAQPDPTPPAAYASLAVGNLWEYQEVDYRFGPGRPYAQRRTVVGDTLVGGETWLVMREQRFGLGYLSGLINDSRRLVRFDAALADGLTRTPAGRAEPLYRCRLDGPLVEGNSVACPSPYSYLRYFKRNSVVFGVRTVVLYISTGFGSVELAAGLGMLEDIYEETGVKLAYARIGGVEYGQRITGLPPVASEPGAPVSDTFALAASPNPTSGTLRLALTLPEAQAVTAEAFDALGRRVWSARLTLGAGPQTIPVDARAWAPGVYVVRAVAGEARATVRVVRR